MKLKDYLTKNRIKQKDFALELGIGQAHMSEIITGNALPSLKLAMLIKKKTAGKVTPDDYRIYFNAAA